MTSLPGRCRCEEKEVALGTVNSEERKKPKYARQQAAQNITSSYTLMPNCRNMLRSIAAGVIGSRVSGEAPWQHSVIVQFVKRC